MSRRISVVVPTYRRPDPLERCLAALLALDFAPTDYEILVVDAASSEQTRRQVERWSREAAERNLPLHYLTAPRLHGPAAARNLGWRSAQGEIIAFTDDDCIPEMSWLKAGSAAFTADMMALSGRIVVPLSPLATEYEYNAARIRYSEFMTANCFYRRSFLEQVGGFDERFALAWQEDRDLFLTLLEREVPYTMEPAAVVMHPVQPARWGSSLAQQRKEMFDALLYKKHRRLYRQKIQAAPPWHYYCIVGALLIILAGVLASSWLLTLVACIAWIAMMARFCLQRLQHTSHAPRHVLEIVITSLLIPLLVVFWRLWGMIRFRVFFL